jgi:ribonuclease HI
MFSKRVIQIYTNSSCVNNGKPFARGAIGIYFPNHEHQNISLAYPAKKLLLPPTNQRCELLAINHSLLIHWLYFRENPCIIHTDSHYSVKCLTELCNTWLQNGWKKFNNEDVKNQDLLQPMHTLFSKNKNIEFHLLRDGGALFDRHSLNHRVAHAFARKGLGFPVIK